MAVPDGTAAGVAPLDSSVDGFFSDMEAIEALSGCDADVDAEVVERSAAMVKFLREWKLFHYEPRVVRFAHLNEMSEAKNLSDEIVLRPFSSAIVPQHHHRPLFEQPTDAVKDKETTDFVLHVGGHAWALDWCPHMQSSPDCNFNCEFLAVAAHCPDTGLHKIGAPLFGRGAIQIWCLVTHNDQFTCSPTIIGHRGKNKKTTADKNAVECLEKEHVVKPRGRPKKRPPENSLEIVGLCTGRPRGRPRKYPLSTDSTQKLPRGRPKKKQNITFSTTSDEGKDKVYQIEGSNTCSSTGGIFLQETSQALGPVDKSLEFTPEHETGVLDKKMNQIMTPKQRALPPKQMPLTSDAGTLGSALLRNEKSGLSIAHTRSCGKTDLHKCRRCPRKISSPSTCEFSTECGFEDRNDKIITNTANCGEIVSAQVAEFVVPLNPVHASECSYSNQEIDSGEILGPKMSSPGTSPRVVANVDEGKVAAVFPASSYVASASMGTREPCNTGKEPAFQNTRDSKLIPRHLVLPRLVFSLAHNGKVAWDIKWRPRIDQLGKKGYLGHLAVLLGDGSLEVWEVPSPKIIRSIYYSSCAEGTDPRFLKLKPVFRNARLRCGNRQCIGLTVDWCPHPPYDMILVGCHDGTVAMWKFSPKYSSEDSKPLLCFSADTVPIRTLSWAPNESGEECSNVFVTAGHDGLKFWDSRDPFHPLWDHSTSPRAVLSFHWSTDPRCLILILDDGTARFIGLDKAANDVAVTGRPFDGKKSIGASSYQLSMFALWDVHVSRMTGLAAYCSADGSAVRFPLTARFVEKIPGRNKTPFYLCGSVSETGGVLNICSPLQNSPLPYLPLPSSKSQKSMSIISKSKSHVKAEQVNSTADPGGGDHSIEPIPDDPQTGEKLVIPEIESSHAQQPMGDQFALPASDVPRTTLRCSALEHISGDERSPAGLPAIVSADQGSKRNSNDLSRGVWQQYGELPPKNVALNRIRWNMNKGSERWLCYGGAAGIVRCQKVPL